MNAALLLAHFDRISDAPDAVPRLRRFILDLAVRGNLAEQREESTALPSNEAIRKKLASRRGAPTIEVESLEFHEIPSPWTWRRLAMLTELITDGEHATPPRISEHQVPLVTAKNVRDGFMDYGNTDWVSSETAAKAWNRCRPAVGDVLLVCVGATIGRLCVLRESKDMVLVRSVALIRPTPAVDADYLALALRSPSSQKQIWEKVKVAAQPCLYINRIASLTVPLPPLPEQHRIVVKVAKLMVLCDRLEAAQRERESRRDQLTASAHHHLNNGEDAKSLRGHAQFFIGNLPRFTIRPDQIKQLRQTILNLAVYGKLLPQNPDDEPAPKLLKRIHTEKARLINERKIDRQRPLPPIPNSALPFRLPKGWSWTRLGELTQLVTSGSRDWAKYYSAEGAIYLRMGNLSRDSYRLRLTNIQHVKPPAGGEGSRTRLEAGDILISITGEVGLLGLIPAKFGEAYINQHTCLVRPMEELVGHFLPLLFCSPFAQEQFDEPQRGLKNSFRLTDVTHFLVPLPPLAEQHRIVAKVDELMALCDQLEASLATAQTEASRLLGSVLHNALDSAFVS
jgi:type I restriction enzyme, S subunit